MIFEKLINTYKSKLRDIDDFMNQGATEEAISELEKLSGHVLPESYKSLLQQYNGAKKHLGIMGGFGLSSVQEVVSAINQAKEFEGKESLVVHALFQDQMIQVDAYLPERIPFANDGSGQYLCIDNAPGVNGQKGQIIYLPLGENEPASVIANSFDEWLEWLISAFADDRFALMDDRKELDEEEWHMAEIYFWKRWKDDWTDVATEYNQRNGI